MSKDSERQAWTRFVEEREREAKRPRVKKQAEEEVSQAELEAGLDELVTDSDRRDAKRRGLIWSGHLVPTHRAKRASGLPIG